MRLRIIGMVLQGEYLINKDAATLSLVLRVIVAKFLDLVGKVG